MSKLTRRGFVAGASTIPFALWLQGCGRPQEDGYTQQPEPQPSGPLVRYDARSPQGQAMLQIYSQAVEKMKNQIAEGDPLSWVFQWYIHGVKGPSSTVPQNKAAEIARIYPTPSPDKDLAEEIWSTCQAHYPGDDENFFLPWHRMYVYFFESIIRQVSGDASFTLPYWNYSTTDPATRGVIPPQFGDSSSPLFVAKRNPGVNGGQPIQQGQPGDPLSLISLSECAYMPAGAQQGFNMRLDFGLHGNIHVLTGNQQNMGAVPWAAGDPIFWMHHCNIDRLWASWNAGGRQNPTDSGWTDKTFVFADANGNRVVGKVGDFTAIAPLGYSYDQLEPVSPCPESRTSETELLTAADAMTVRGAASTAVALGSEPVRVRLSAPAGGEDFSLADPLESPQRRLYLVVRGLETDLQPGVLYNLYLGLPEGADPAASEPHLAGSVNFFGALHGGHGGEGAAQGPSDRFVSFDVTELAQRLGAAGTGEPVLTVAPSGQPAGEARPVLAEVRLVSQ